MKRPAAYQYNKSLWASQVLVSLSFLSAAVLKLCIPLQTLGGMMPWVNESSPLFVRSIGLIDLAGAVGIVVPWYTRILPGLTVPAAYGCAALMACAIVFHVQLGEAALTPFNFVLLGLSLFIAWGRALPNKKQW